MENRCINALSHIRCVLTRSTFDRNSSETDLVINDNMNGAADRVVSKGLHLNLLVHDTLTGHSGISVNNDGHDGAAVTLGATESVLLGADSSHNDGVDSFQMGWVSQASNSYIL